VLDAIRSYLDEVAGLVLRVPPEGIGRTTELILDTWRRGGRVFVFGNGGGSATAAPFVCDLAKGTARAGRRRIKAICLADNVPLLTAWANDTDYTNTFGEQLRNLVEAGDLVLGLSGRGTSPNVINALKLANEIGAVSVLFSGFDGGEAASVASHSVIVPSDDMQKIEDVHLILAHIVFRCLKEQMAAGEV